MIYRYNKKDRSVILIKTLFVFLLIFLISFEVEAQEKNYKYDKGSKVHITTHKFNVPEDGSYEEGINLVYEWTENILRKNENFKNIRLLMSETEEDTLDLKVVYTYADNPIRSTNSIIQDQILEYWGSMEKFQNFLEKLGKYIDPSLNEVKKFDELVIPN